MIGRLGAGVITWIAGPGHGIADSQLIAIVGSEIPPEVIREWWDQDRSAPAPIERLVARLDDFPATAAAIAVSSDDEVELRLLLRASASATWSIGGSDESAVGAVSWSEHNVRGCERLWLALDPAEPEPTHALPTLGGIFPAAVVAWIRIPTEPVNVLQPVVERTPDPKATSESASAGGEFEDLWGEHTVMGRAEDAAVRHSTRERDRLLGVPEASDLPEPAPAAATDVPSEQSSGFSEATWHSTEAIESEPVTAPLPTAGRPGALPPSPARAASAPAPRGPDSDDEELTRLQTSTGTTSPAQETVLATVCRNDHANPPSKPTCRICAQPIDGPARQVVRPNLGRMITSAGDIVPLYGTILVGRSPRPQAVSAGMAVRTVVLHEPHVSGRHLELRVEGWNLLVRDVGSTNGTFLHRHGQPAVRLPETLQLVVAGDVIDLGHGVNIRFEDLA